MNNKSGLKIHIEKDFCSDNVKIYAYEEYPDGRGHYWMDNGKMIGSFAKTGEFNEFANKPMLEFPIKFYEAFEAALIQEADKQNRKTENHHKLEGTLAATVKHLEDLRVIVFSEYRTKPNQ